MTVRGFTATEATGTAVWYLDSLMTVLASSTETEGRFGLLEVRANPGMSGPQHVHHRHDEAFYILEGRVRARCGDEEYEAGPGTFIWLPRAVPHQLGTLGDEPVRMLEFSLPGGVEEFHRDAGVPAEARVIPPQPVVPDMAKLRKLAAMHDVEVLAPLPPAAQRP